MMICPNCGQGMPDTANVCGNCGTHLKALVQAPVAPEAPPIVTPSHKEGAGDSKKNPFKLRFKKAVTWTLVGLGIALLEATVTWYLSYLASQNSNDFLWPWYIRFWDALPVILPFMLIGFLIGRDRDNIRWVSIGAICIGILRLIQYFFVVRQYLVGGKNLDGIILATFFWRFIYGAAYGGLVAATLYFLYQKILERRVT